MIRKFTLLLLFSLPFLLFAQDLTGIWRGNFSQKNFNPMSGNFADDTYKYEVQIIQKPDNSIDGVTYSYKKTEFYGKASLHGLISKKTKNIIIKEIRLIEHHSNNNTSTTCLMTCYFDYVKRGKLEVLTGTYTSINTDAANNSNCGEGTVYLEKVEQSDFDEEKFLTKKKSNTASKPKMATKESGSPNKNIAKSNKSTDNQSATHFNKKDTPASKHTENHAITKKHSPNEIKKNTVVKTKIDSSLTAADIHSIKPGAETFVLKNKTDNQMDTFYKYKIDTTIYVYDSPSNKRSKKNSTDSSIAVDRASISSTKPEQKNTSDTNILQIPRPLIERENKLVNTIEVDEKEVRIDFYDNGEIDNDTISVYDNNRIIVNEGRLTYTPITLNLSFSNENKVHEIITVAENLGDIPPNTALMVITFGRKRFEVFITSDEKRNAKVVLEYKAKPKFK